MIECYLHEPLYPQEPQCELFTLIANQRYLSHYCSVLRPIPRQLAAGWFILIEGITRKPLKPQIANAMNFVDFALLMLLMVAVTYHNIAKLVR